MATMLSGESMLLNMGTRVVLAGRLTFWTDHRGRSIVHVKNPQTGMEDRIELKAPRPWWVIQWIMQLIAETFEGSPLLEVTKVADTGEACTKCGVVGGGGGAYDKEGNWIDCPVCGS